MLLFIIPSNPCSIFWLKKINKNLTLFNFFFFVTHLGSTCSSMLIFPLVQELHLLWITSLWAWNASLKVSIAAFLYSLSAIFYHKKRVVTILIRNINVSVNDPLIVFLVAGSFVWTTCKCTCIWKLIRISELWKWIGCNV